jgi:hypothetical protein
MIKLTVRDRLAHRAGEAMLERNLMDLAYRKLAHGAWGENRVGPPPAASAEEAALAIDREIQRLGRQCARLRYQWEHGLLPSRLSELEEADPLTEREAPCDPAIRPLPPVPARAAA